MLKEKEPEKKEPFHIMYIKNMEREKREEERKQREAEERRKAREEEEFRNAKGTNMPAVDSQAAINIDLTKQQSNRMSTVDTKES